MLQTKLFRLHSDVLFSIRQFLSRYLRPPCPLLLPAYGNRRPNWSLPLSLPLLPLSEHVPAGPSKRTSPKFIDISLVIAVFDVRCRYESRPMIFLPSPREKKYCAEPTIFRKSLRVSEKNARDSERSFSWSKIFLKIEMS
jgi:hypothetical protein